MILIAETEDKTILLQEYAGYRFLDLRPTLDLTGFGNLSGLRPFLPFFNSTYFRCHAMSIFKILQVVKKSDYFLPAKLCILSRN